MTDCNGVSLAIQFGGLIMSLIFGLLTIVIAIITLSRKK